MKRKHTPGTADLLRIASRLSDQVMKAEKPEALQAKYKEESRVIIDQAIKEIEEGKNTSGLMFKITQMTRDAGRMGNAEALAFFYHSFLNMDKEDKDAIPDHPAMNKIMDRYQDLDTEEGKTEYAKAWTRCRFASVLRHIGEYEIANLVLNDPETANKCIREGMSKWTLNDPDMVLDDAFFEKISL